MKLVTTLALGLVLSINLFGQESKVQELVAQGVELNDRGKYDDAIDKYKAALKIDKNSSLANYEMAYTCMLAQKFDDGVKYSKKVIDQKGDNELGAYVVWGSCLDLLGKPEKALKAYEEGLAKYPDNYLLNYNFAITSYNQKHYDAAENAAIKAVSANPKHSSSHLILSAVMQSKGQRVKSLLSMYYFLMLEPSSKRSKPNYGILKNQLGQGVKQKDEKTVSVMLPMNSADDDFGAAEVTLSLLEASKHTEASKGKNDMELFIETTKSLFSILGSLKKENTGFWWDVYVTQFNDLVDTKNEEAFCYYVSQSGDVTTAKKWLAANSDKLKEFEIWMSKK